jgi:alpha-beta hydrolase superfamily lysophospholipase
MLEAIANRELIVLDGLGSRIQGTYHRPADGFTRTASDASGKDHLGILFVNSLSLPRAASGDAAVQWAEAFAQRGYPTFRVDLPGLGDSEGDASTDLLDVINAGGFASVAAATAKELVHRFQLSGLVLFGHCAGSVSALYAAAAGKECKGLVLLDPYFHLPQVKRSRVREELSDWARRSAVGRILSNMFDRAKNLALVVNGGAPPGNANEQLLACWKQVATAGLPILLLQAPGIKANGSKPRVGDFDYIDHVVKVAGRKSRVSVEFIESADHSFANSEGRQAVQQHMEDWLASEFPLAGRTMKGKTTTPLRTSDAQGDSKRSSSAPADMGCVLEGR